MGSLGSVGRWNVLALVCLATACASGEDEVPGEVEVFAGIDEGETIKALGTEPFWGAEISGSTLTYSTPDTVDGTPIEVSRFAGNGGLGFNGTFEGKPLQMAVTPSDCSDQMSDRIYPFTVTLRIGESRLDGCAYTDRQPFEGEENP